MRTQKLLRAVLVMSLMAPSIGRGQQEPDPIRLKEASDEFDEGMRLFKQQQYEQAAERFEMADRLSRSSAALANAIRARKAAKQTTRAASLSAQAVLRYPEEGALRDLAEGVLKVQSPLLHRVDV